MALTGMQRSLTVIINKTIAGVQVEDYPRTYNGCNEFSINGTTYLEIDKERMATMPTVEYLDRLNAFKSYVESLEQGLDIDSCIINGATPYLENLIACPIN